jgi:Gly-Xaa carboxypeptidase
MAAPSSSEKGYFDVRVRVATEGGHSSVPFLHSKHGISAIGIMSELVVALHNNPYPSDFEADDPLIAYLACAAEHAPNFPKKWSKLLEKGSKGWLELADEFAALGPMEHCAAVLLQRVALRELTPGRPPSQRS